MNYKKLSIFLIIIGIFFSMIFCEGSDAINFDTEAYIEGSGEWIEYEKELAERLRTTATQASGGTTATTTTITTAATQETRTYTTLNFGITPWTDLEILQRVWGPIVRYISEQIGINITFNAAPDYNTLWRDLQNDNIQLAAFSPAAFATALVNYPNIKYISTMNLDNEYYYNGVIITQKNNPIQNLEDMRGKSIAFVDVNSASGYKYPVALFLNNGIDPETYFSNIFFLGNHANVLEAVHNGSVDIGATYTTQFENYQRNNNEPLKTIMMTPDIPFDGFAATHYLSDELVEKIQNLMNTIDTNSKLKDGSPVLVLDSIYPITGFSIRDRSFYDVVINTARLVEEYENRDKAKDITKDYTVLNFGVTPWTDPDILQKAWVPVLNYLSEKIGVNIIFNISPDYATLQEDLENDNIQFGSFSPSALAGALESYPKLKYIATTFVNDAYFYDGLIFTRNDSPIKTIEDMKGKSIAFVDVNSSSGYKYPVSIFLQQNIDPETYFSNIFFLGSHQRVLEAVLNGSVDIGTTTSTALTEGAEANYNIISRTPIPEGGVAASHYLSDDLINKIQELLENIDKNTKLRNGSNVLAMEDKYNLTGFVVRDKSFYDVVTRTAKLIEEYEKRRAN